MARKPRAAKEARRPQLLQQQRLKRKKKKSPRPSRPCRCLFGVVVSGTVDARSASMYE